MLLDELDPSYNQLYDMNVTEMLISYTKFEKRNEEFQRKYIINYILYAKIYSQKRGTP